MIGDAASRERAEAFLLREARLLDEARYEQWLSLFTEDAWYWVPSQAGQESPRNTVSLIYDDRRLLETRVRRLLNPSIHAQNPPSRSSRIVANVTLESDGDDGDLETRSKLLLTEYRRNRLRTYAGTAWHRLVRDGKAFRIASKRVDLIDCDGELEGLVVPL